MDEDIIKNLEILRNWLSKAKVSSASHAFSKILNLFTFEVIAHPGDPEWPQRVSEEIIVFRNFKRTIYGDLLPHFRNLQYSWSNEQIFYVEFMDKLTNSWKKCEITLPKLYPLLPPNSLNAIDGSIRVYSSHTDPNKCLGEILKRRWDESGKMGIAHWLIFVEVFWYLLQSPIKIT
ncbi:MAG: hypothetical protein ACTSVA_05900 [Candidatus Njordarchaeales archaeon]